jgi:hypothetical protein
MTPEERFERIENVIEKQNHGIRDLVRVSRIFLDSQQEVKGQIQENAIQIQENTTHIRELREAQKQTDEKLNILIDTVDRIIRHWNGGQR